mmetsp:Transcript_17135/g.42160  ORF Transcript_17135/g.42160 Transcript_17135/m.42160 type:complete len:255 (-) Transcript_17135:125-889(-)
MRHDRKPPQTDCSILKNVSKNMRVPLMSSSMRVSAPKHMNVRMRSSSAGQMARHTLSEMASASMTPPLSLTSAFWASRASTMVSTSTITVRRVLDTMKPVEGCTMPAAPPMPMARCGNLGSTPPMGMRQYSSSSTRFTLMSMASRRCASFTLRSSNSRLGRSTRLVSSKKILVSVKGMEYRNVGVFLLTPRRPSSRCPSRQSMNSMVSMGNPCGSSVSHMIPNAVWYPGVKSRSNSTSLRAWPEASSTSLVNTS